MANAMPSARRIDSVIAAPVPETSMTNARRTERFGDQHRAWINLLTSSGDKPDTNESKRRGLIPDRGSNVAIW